MGAFIILIVVVMIMLAVFYAPQDDDRQIGGITDTRPGLQATAGNMFEFHRQVVDFVSQTANRNPSNGSAPNEYWAFSATSQAAVRCNTYSGGTYPTGSSSGTCTAPTTEFRQPVFFSNLYNWRVCYVSDGAGGNDDIAITYAVASETPGGFSQTQIAAALKAFRPNDEAWYYGVTTAGSVISDESGNTKTLGGCASPCGTACAGVVAIATVIP